MFQRLLLVLLSIFLFSFSTQKVFSEVYDFAPIDSLFSLITKHNRGMGSIAIRKDGNLLYSKSMGYSMINGNDKKLSNSETGYRIGSITKMFTSVIIFQLIEQGKLSLETPLSTFFPEIKNSKTITISRLLHHRSGIHNFTDDADYKFYFQSAKTKKEMIEIIKKKGNDFEPNEKAAYSNANYVLLGYIAEDITNKSYSELIKSNICDKIDLKRTYLGNVINESKNEAQSYIFMNNSYKKTTETHPTVAYSAGALVSTPEDVTKFIDALFHFKLLKKESLDKMVELVDNYGRGIFRYPFDNSWLFGHTGGIDNFQSMTAFDTETGISVSYTANAVSFPVNDILIFVLSQVYKRGVVYPNFETKEVAESILKTYAGDYTSKKVPITLKVMVKNGKLYAQATGQEEFPLDAISDTKFEFLPARITMEFEPSTNSMKFEQSGLKYTFTRK